MLAGQCLPVFTTVNYLHAGGVIYLRITSLSLRAFALEIVLMTKLILKFKTPAAWAIGIAADMDAFLPDHAAAEKKASSMAMTMVAHYPDKPELLTAMIDLALEELNH